jgi:hypothetical protein
MDEQKRIFEIEERILEKAATDIALLTLTLDPFSQRPRGRQRMGKKFSMYSVNQLKLILEGIQQEVKS